MYIYIMQLSNSQLTTYINDLISINQDLSSGISENDNKILESYLPTAHIKKIKNNLGIDIFLNNVNNNANTKKYTQNFLILLIKCIVLLILTKNNSFDYNIILSQLDNELQIEIINNANKIIEKMSLDNKTTATILSEPSEPSEPFDIIREIDKYIKSFTIEQLLEKPSFILPKPKFIVNQVTNIINKEKTDEIFDDSDNNVVDYDYDYTNKSNKDNKNNKTKLSGIEMFNQKKILYDIMTKFISNKILENKPEIIFNFQYLVNTFFSNFVKEYIKREKLNDDDVLFVYKGGTTIKIIYEKYNKLFTGSKLFKDLEANFGRSDSDYAFFIKKEENKKDPQDLNKYNKIYVDIYVMCYNILHKINLFINKSLYSKYLLPLESVNQENIFGVINTMNNSLTDLNYFKDVEKIIGITINDNTYMQDKIPDKFDIYYLKNGDVDSKSGSDNKNFITTDAKRRDFYITWLKENMENSPRGIGYINDANNTFQSLNDNIYFINDADKVTNFSLHRIKLNTIIYFKTRDGRYGKMNCPSEIIDVSIGSWADSKSFIDLNKSIKKYTHKNSITNHNVIFNSYTLYGFIEDLVKQLFIEVKFIWDAPKYDKKIRRMILLLCIYLYNKESYETLEIILPKFVSDLNDIKSSKASSSNVKDDTFLQEILDKFNNMKIDIKSLNNGTTLFNTSIDLFIDNINVFINDLKSINKNINTNYNDVPESIPYLKKYLKYKQKYLNLAKNI